MPGFQMYDPYVTRELTVRDLLVLAAGWGWARATSCSSRPSDLSREEIIGGCGSSSRLPVSAAVRL